MPSPLTDLIGRTAAVAQARALLDTARLVTLTGPGGVGKTRLALATAAQLTEGFPDGVWLVELGALEKSTTELTSSLARVVEMVATVLGVRDDSAAGPVPATESAARTDRLASVLHAKRMLLVLDNCEHVIEPVARLAELLLQSAPGLRILATSQEPLGLGGELLQAVPPLELPDPGATPEPVALAQSSAVALFMARAAAATPDFALDQDNAAAVAAICRRLDGIPLALELAAARVRALGVHELAARLDDRFHLLASGKRDAPARQRTLQAMISWSWELLTAPERTVLRRLAIHADGCTLLAAEEACAGGDLAGRDVLDLLARLVDRSLVTTVDTPDGPRYRLLESVAAYCLERLREAGEFDRLRQRHSDYYTAFAEQADPHLRGHAQRQWLRRLDAETANLRAVLDSAAQRRDPALALRLTCALAWYWVLRGRLGEGRRSLAIALAVDGPAPAAIRATATVWHAGIAALAGEGPDPSVGQGPVGQPPDDVVDPRRRARAELLLAVATPTDPDRADGDDPVRRALATFRALGDPWGTAAALSTLAWNALLRSDFAAVRRDAEQSLALFRELGDHWGVLQATVRSRRWPRPPGITSGRPACTRTGYASPRNSGSGRGRVQAERARPDRPARPATRGRRRPARTGDAAGRGAVQQGR